MKDQGKWDGRYLDLARFIATWSRDPSTKVGAVLVGEDRRNVALGYNGFPPEVVDDPTWLLDREAKYALTIHAERNALDNAGFDLRGSTLYVTSFPCVECAKSAVRKGVCRVVCPPPPAPDPERPWTLTTKWTRVVLEGAGVTLEEERCPS